MPTKIKTSTQSDTLSKSLVTPGDKVRKKCLSSGLMRPRPRAAGRNGLDPPVLGTAVFFYGGWPFLTGAVTELKDRQPGMMLLISLGISVSFGASLATSLGIGGVSLDFWWELALLVVIMLLGHWLEMRALGQASSALDALATLLPDEAERAGTDGHMEPSASERCPGDIVLVRSGARVPADGTVIDGAADMDESMITGESRPVSKRRGDRVVASTVGTDSALRVRIEAVGKQQHWRVSAASLSRPNSHVPGPKRSPTGPPPCCFTSLRPPVPRPSRPGQCSGTSQRLSSAPSRCW